MAGLEYLQEIITENKCEAGRNFLLQPSQIQKKAMPFGLGCRF